MNDLITKERTFEQPIDRVWAAITQAEEISKWFLLADFKAEKGYQYTFKSKDNSCPPIVGEVLSANPYTLSYTWIEKGKPITTTVSWDLESTAEGGTKLLLKHWGIANYEGETAVEMFGAFSGGWENCLAGLTAFLKSEVHAGSH